MSSIALQVRQCIRKDPCLQEGLARDVISHAKLARWLQETHGIGGSEHAVISALRRLENMEEGNPVEEAREAIRHLDLGGGNDVVLVRLPNSGAGIRIKDRIQDGLEIRSTFETQSTITIIVDDSEVDELRRILPGGVEIDLEVGLLTLSDPKGLGADGSAIIALVNQTLGGLVRTQFASREEIHLIVRREDLAQAREMLRALMDDS